MKQQFIQLLRSTNRQGIENVINWLEESDFFTAPASTMFHSHRSANYPADSAAGAQD